MFRRSLVLFVLCAFLAAGVPAQTKFDYPKPRRAEQVDEYHGVKVADPYRWMEDAPLNAETQGWIEAQNKLTNSYLATIPEREKIEELADIYGFLVKNLGMKF
jgi:prolyl oligopeptidase